MQPSKNQLTTACPDSWIATVFYSILSTNVLLSRPAITLSAALSKSYTVTLSLFDLAANIAPSLHKFAISAPEKPGVKVDNLFAHVSIDNEESSYIGFKWTKNIYLLPSKSGRVMSIALSNLPGLYNAGSNNSFLFVAANIITFYWVSNPSISTSN